MKNNDANLIQRTLEGDQQAFAALVEKYQKQIHALAWQKIGDFHIAQEITQDAFLAAYQKLATLTHHSQFAGWLYVIARNKCKNWHRKKGLALQSLEETDPVELEEVYYSEYMTQQREEAANKKRRAIVQKLLSKLQESERTVVNMYYIAEMTCEDIGKFLGVSPNTVRSKLHRARNKMKKDETMIKENLSSFQLPAQITENIMKEILRLNPMAPSGSKPLVPLAVSAVSAILVFLLMGVGAKHLYRFQKPYNLTAQSEPMIELIETQLVIDTPAKPALRTQIGRSDVSDKSEGTGQKSDNSLFAAAQVDEDETSTQKRQWIQAKGPEGGTVTNLYATTRGDMFAGTLSGLYRLTDDGSKWKLINTRNALSFNIQSKGLGWGAMGESGDTIYLATSTELLASTDRGDIWKSLGTHPEGLPIGLVITDQAFYLGLSNGIFRSNDGGISWLRWAALGNEGTDIEIRAIAAIKDTLFASTDKGLYRLNDDVWEQISIGQGKEQEKDTDIHALAVEGDHLYVVPVKPKTTRGFKLPLGNKVSITIFGWSLYHSNDKGDSWDLITNKEKIMDEESKSYVPLQVLGPRRHQFPFSVMGPNLRVKIAAEKGRIVVIDSDYQSYSINEDGTWVLDDITNVGHRIDKTSMPVMLNPNTIYRTNTKGIYRTTDGGESWQEFNSGLTGITILSLAAINDSLCAITSEGLITSTDNGESWTNSFLQGGGLTMSIKKSGSVLYVRTDRMLSIMTDMNKEHPDMKMGNMIIYSLSLENNRTTRIREATIFDSNNQPDVAISIFPGNFAVSGTTFYAEYDKKLFKWKPGTTEWHNTGLIDEGEAGYFEEFTDILDSTSFQLAVSGSKVYVGKRDGHLMQSFNEGDTWNDITSNLPFSVKHFYDIDFAGSTIYVATDKGVLYSINGTDWHATIDTEDTPIVIKRFTVDGTTVYGVVGQQVYELQQNSDTWKQMTPEIPSPISSLTVANNTLYVGTFGHGVLRFSIDN